MSIPCVLNSVATTSPVSTDTYHPKRYMAQDFLLIWADENIDQYKQDYQNTLAQLPNDVNIFKSSDECVDFLCEVNDEKIFMIVSGTMGEQIVPLIHEMPQLDIIYVFCNNRSRHEQWTKEWHKVKGVHTQITPICEALHLAVRQCNQDSIAMSFGTASNQNLVQLKPSFMYTQIFKEILVRYCREQYPDNQCELAYDYRPQSSICSYTLEYFTYHRQDSEKLLKTKGGLMFFNKFLSTSKDREMSFYFFERVSKKIEMIIDPSISSTPFAAIRAVNYYKTEDEVLFSMHTIFRIGEIKKIDINNRFYQVELKITIDDDQQLLILTEHIPEETIGWKRLGNLLLDQTFDEGEKALYYHHLEYVENDQDDYARPFGFKKALKTYQKTLPSNHSYSLFSTTQTHLMTSHSNTKISVN